MVEAEEGLMEKMGGRLTGLVFEGGRGGDGERGVVFGVYGCVCREEGRGVCCVSVCLWVSEGID